MSFEPNRLKVLLSKVWLPAVFVVCAGGLSACETAKRLAPPGFIKYEDLAKGIPPNATIQERIDERTGSGNSGNAETRYPDLTQTPTAIPVGIDVATRQEDEASLLLARDEMQSAIAEARAAVAAEADVDAQINSRVRSLEEQIANDRVEVIEEVKEKLPEPLATPTAPRPQEPKRPKG